MSFPAFTKFAKNVTDLLDFNDANTLEVTRTTASGIKLVTETTSSDSLSAKVTGTVSDKSLGKLTTEGSTAGAFKTKAVLTKLADDVQVTVTHDYGSKGNAVHSLSVAGDYSQKLFVVSGDVKVTEGKDKASGAFVGSVVGGDQGVVVGVQGKADVYPKQALTDYAGAIQYSQDDTYVAVTTANKFTAFNVFLSQVYNNTTAGVKVTYDTVGAVDPKDEAKKIASTNYAAVIQQTVDDATSAKISYNDAGNVGFSLTHQLTNPAFSVTLATASTPTFRKFSADSVNVSFSVSE